MIDFNEEFPKKTIPIPEKNLFNKSFNELYSLFHQSFRNTVYSSNMYKKEHHVKALLSMICNYNLSIRHSVCDRLGFKFDKLTDSEKNYMNEVFLSVAMDHLIKLLNIDDSYLRNPPGKIH